VNQQTGALVNALHAVTGHISAIATGLLAGTLSTAKQHEFAGLLIELGELLHSHADDQEAGVIPLSSEAAGERPQRRALEPTKPEQRSGDSDDPHPS
jgi:hypothetical protein